MVLYSISSSGKRVRFELLQQFFQADMGAKSVITEGRLPKPLTARIVPFHVVDQLPDPAPQRRSRRRMPRRLSAERGMRLIWPLQTRFLEELVEQRSIFFRRHDQRRRFIGHELGHR